MCKINSSLYYIKSVAPGPAEAGTEGRWAPNTDVYLVEDGIVITVELAGIRREDLEITVEGSRILIGGNRPNCGRGPHCRFLMMEINYGHFESVIDLPPGYDLSKARASYQNGFLKVEVPQSASEPRTVPIASQDER